MSFSVWLRGEEICILNSNKLQTPFLIKGFIPSQDGLFLLVKHQRILHLYIRLFQKIEISQDKGYVRCIYVFSQRAFKVV